MPLSNDDLLAIQKYDPQNHTYPGVVEEKGRKKLTVIQLSLWGRAIHPTGCLSPNKIVEYLLEAGSPMTYMEKEKKCQVFDKSISAYSQDPKQFQWYIEKDIHLNLDAIIREKLRLIADHLLEQTPETFVIKSCLINLATEKIDDSGVDVRLGKKILRSSCEEIANTIGKLYSQSYSIQDSKDDHSKLDVYAKQISTYTFTMFEKLLDEVGVKRSISKTQDLLKKFQKQAIQSIEEMYEERNETSSLSSEVNTLQTNIEKILRGLGVGKLSVKRIMSDKTEALATFRNKYPL